MNFLQKLFNEAKKFSSFEEAKQIDKKIMVPVGIFLAVLTVLFYYYIFMIYPAHKDAERAAGLAKLKQEQAAKTKVELSKDEIYNRAMDPEERAYRENLAKSQSTEPGDANKIPGNYMDIHNIAPQNKQMYMNAFDIIYDFFDDINKRDFESAMKLLDKDFVGYNKLTSESLNFYQKEMLFEKTTFNMVKVQKQGNYYYVNLGIINNDIDGMGFEAVYRLVDNKGKLSIVADDIAEYVKNKRAQGNGAPSDALQKPAQQ